ncbi:MAG: hypothetical protein U1A78_23740 [Polyangia bacterium]
MKTTLKKMFALMLAVGSAPGISHAGPGETGQDAPVVAVLAGSDVACPVRGNLCVRAGAPSTQPVGTLLSATLGAHGLSWDAPRFVRVFSSELSTRSAADAVPWTVQVNARLHRPAWAGNSLFILSDAEDPEQAGASGLVTALYQAPIAAGERLIAKLRLTPDDGFRPGHTYKLRVVQLIEGVEIELAAGELRLE